MTVKTYWDHTEQERAAMSSDEVDALLKFALMEAGIVTPTEPTYELEDEPELPTRTYYTVSFRTDYSKACGIMFETVEQAQAFIDLQPIEKGSDYLLDFKDFASRMQEMEIVTAKLPSRGDVEEHQGEIKRAKAAKEANKKKRDAYNKACNAASQATEGVWDDWHKCRRLDESNERIVATWNDYVATCEGDREIAAKFFQKAFSDHDTVSAAFSWFGEPSPLLSADAESDRVAAE